ncbi:MAG: hypothetical protein WCJ55_17080 [Chloroflexales bacterium]
MEPKRKRSGGNNWVGMVIFLVLAFGSPLARIISSLIFQSIGVTVSSNVLAIGLVTLIVLAVAVAAIGSALRGTGRINTGSATQLPPGPTTPPQIGVPTQFPGSPRFEPVINPRILTIGIVGLIIFGGVFLAILAIFG